MPKLNNLNQSILTLEGNPIADLTKKKTMTYQSALISCLEMHRPKSPGTGEALKAFDIGIRFLKAKESIELEKEDLAFLKVVVDTSSIFLSVVIGRLLHYLSETNEKKVDSK